MYMFCTFSASVQQYHCEFIIIPNHEYDIIYEKLAHNIFFKLKTLIHEPICAKRNNPKYN